MIAQVSSWPVDNEAVSSSSSETPAPASLSWAIRSFSMTRMSPFQSVSAVSTSRSSRSSTTASETPASVRIQLHWADEEVS